MRSGASFITGQQPSPVIPAGTRLSGVKKSFRNNNGVERMATNELDVQNLVDLYTNAAATKDDILPEIARSAVNERALAAGLEPETTLGEGSIGEVGVAEARSARAAVRAIPARAASSATSAPGKVQALSTDAAEVALSVSPASVANRRSPFAEEGMAKCGEAREGRGRKFSVRQELIRTDRQSLQHAAFIRCPTCGPRTAELIFAEVACGRIAFNRVS
jgi:hypothetical protein